MNDTKNKNFLREQYVNSRITRIVEQQRHLNELYEKVGLVIVENFEAAQAQKLMNHMNKLTNAFGTIRDKVPTLWSAINDAKEDAKNALAAKPSWIPGRTKKKLYKTVGMVTDLELKLTKLTQVMPQILKTVSQLGQDEGGKIDLTQPLVNQLDDKAQEQMKGMISSALGGTKKIFGVTLPWQDKIPYISSKDAVVDEMLNLTGAEIEEFVSKSDDVKTMPVNQEVIQDFGKEAAEATEGDPSTPSDVQQVGQKSNEMKPENQALARIIDDLTAAVGQDAIGSPEKGVIPIKTKDMLAAIRDANSEEFNQIQRAFLTNKLKFEGRGLERRLIVAKSKPRL